MTDVDRYGTSLSTEGLGYRFRARIERATPIYAAAVVAREGTSRDEWLKGYEREGFLKLRLSTHGENTYEITSKGATGYLADAR